MKCPNCDHVSADSALLKCSNCQESFERGVIEELGHLEYMGKWIKKHSKEIEDKTITLIREGVNKRQDELFNAIRGPVEVPQVQQIPAVSNAAAPVKPVMAAAAIPAVRASIASKAVPLPKAAPKPKPAAPPKPTRPPVDWKKVRERVVDAASSGALLRALLYLGAFMIVISATVLVIRFWDVFNPVLQLVFIASVPLMFYTGGWGLRTRLKLTQAGTVLTGIGAILVAVDFAAIYQLGGLASQINGPFYWLGVALFCSILYAYTSWQVRGEFFDYLTLIAGASVFFAFTRVIKIPIEWSVVSVTASAMIMTVMAGRFAKPGTRWDGLAKASRYLSQMLIPASVVFLIFSRADLPILFAFVFATIGYSLLAWNFPNLIFAFCALGASIGAVVFVLRATDLPVPWFATVGSVLALVYILIGQQVKGLKLESKILQNYAKAINTTSFVLIGLAAMQGFITALNFEKAWPGIIALGIASLDLSVCAYLFQRSRYTLLASGLFIVPFTLAIARELDAASIDQGLAWLTVAWGILSLVYLALATLLRKTSDHARWLHVWAHALILFSLFFLPFDRWITTADTWVNTPALISVGLSIAVYLTSFVLQDNGGHPALSTVSKWLPYGLGKSIFLWPIGLLLPIWTAIAWYGSDLPRAWFGTTLTGFALAYLGVGQFLFKRAKEYRFPLNVFVYLLCMVGIPISMPDRYALLSALIVTVACAGLLAYLYDRLVESIVAGVLFIWPFQLSLEIIKIDPYARSLGYMLLAGLIYIPLAVTLKNFKRSREAFQHAPLFTIGYALTAFAVLTSLIGRTSDSFAPWIGAAVPFLATALLIFSAGYFKSARFEAAWAWAGTLTFAIAFGGALTLFKLPAEFDALAWVGLAALYMSVDRLLSRLAGTSTLDRHWFDQFHMPLISGMIALAVLGLGLSLPDTFTAFLGNQPADFAAPILAQVGIVILSIVAAGVYGQRWPLFIEPFLAFLPATLFFVGYGEKIFDQALSTPQYALVWLGLGMIHLLAAVFTDPARVRYANGLYPGGYLLIAWAVMWSVIDEGTLVWTLGLSTAALIGSAVLVHLNRHRTWDEFIQLLFGESKDAVRIHVRNAFQWMAAWTFPIWLVLLLRQLHVPSDLIWLGIVVPAIAYLALAQWLQRFDRSYTFPLLSAGQFYTFIGLLISAPETVRYLANLSGASSPDRQLGWIVLQSIAVVFYAGSAWTYKSRAFAYISAVLSIIPFTVAWDIYGVAFTPPSLVIPWLIWSSALLAIGFALDENKVRYAHGPYAAGYALAILALASSSSARLSNIYALAITIALALASYVAVHFGRHHTFEDFVRRFWKNTSETAQKIVATSFLTFAAIAIPVLLAQITAQLKYDLPWRGVLLALAAPLFIAMGLAVRYSKPRSIATAPTGPLYGVGYALTAIGAMISFGDEHLVIYVLALDAAVFAASAYIFQQVFWLYLSTVLTPVIALLFLHYSDRLETRWVAWIFIGLAYLYLLIGQVFDRTKKADAELHAFAAPFYVPGFLLSAIALAISSSDKILALQVYSAGVVLYALAGWLLGEALFIYPAAWLASIPYFLLITMTDLETRWYGLAWLPLIVLYIALGRFVFHKRPLAPLGKGVLVEWLTHPAIPFYLLAYALSLSMISLSYVSPLSLTLAFAAAALLYLVSAYLFLAPWWIYAGLFSAHMAVLAFFTITPSGKGAHYITLPFLGMTWLTALLGYGFSRWIAAPKSRSRKPAYKFTLLDRLLGHPWSRPFFTFAVVEMILWQSVALNGYDTTIILGTGHALLFGLFSLLWMEGVLTYGMVGFGLLAIGAWMKESQVPFAQAVAIYSGIGLGLYLLARILEPLSARIKALTVWLEPLTYSAIALTGVAAVINLSRTLDNMTATAAALAAAGALYVAIAYRGRQYSLGYLGMALLEIAWAMALFISDVVQPQWYAIPGGLYFMGLAYLEWQRDRSKYAVGIELLGLGILLVTTFTQSINGTQGFIYFVLLIIESLLVGWWGLVQHRKIPFFTGIGFIVLNFLAQLILLVTVHNISVWLVGLGVGLIIMALAVWVELRREQLRIRIHDWTERLETWD